MLADPQGTGFQRSISEIYAGKHGRPKGTGPECHRNGYSKSGSPVTRKPRYKDPEHIGALPNCQQRRLRVIDEISGTPLVLPMADVWQSGVKEIFRLQTLSGSVIRCSVNHPFFTREGWATVRDLSPGDAVGRYGMVASQERPLPPALRIGIGVWTSMMRKRLIKDVDTCYVCGLNYVFDSLELDHVEPVYRNLKRALDEENLRPICASCHRNKTGQEQPSRKGQTRAGVRWDRITQIERVGEEQTYDISVGGPHHNFVANGFVVHNSYNELSARYTPLPDVNYLPTVDRMLISGGKNKQAQPVTPDGTLATEEQLRASFADWQLQLRDLYARAQHVYEQGLLRGVPKEIARCAVPVSRYSRMRASANLRNWLGFLKLRMAENAQWEIRQYANALHSVLSEKFPRTLALFDEGR